MPMLNTSTELHEHSFILYKPCKFVPCYNLHNDPLILEKEQEENPSPFISNQISLISPFNPCSITYVDNHASNCIGCFICFYNFDLEF